jgi:hypothetical protein
MVVVHFPLTLDFTSEGEQAQGLSQFIEVKEFRVVRSGECSPSVKFRRASVGPSTPRHHQEGPERLKARN